MQDRHERYCAICGCLDRSEDVWHVCPVCFWQKSVFENIADHQIPDNMMLTPAQAKENYKEFGAVDRISLPYVREPLPFEISEKTLETKGHPPDRREKLWFEELPKEMPIKDFFLILEPHESSLGATCYRIDGDRYYIYHDWRKPENSSVYDRYHKHFVIMRRTPGMHIYEFRNGEYVGHRYYSDPIYLYLLGRDALHTILTSEHGLQPGDEEGKRSLSFEIEREKKQLGTLYHACYINDTRMILDCLENLSSEQAKEMREDSDLMLRLAAKNKNFHAFRALCESEALRIKTSVKFEVLEDTLLETSADIILYMYENFPDKFLEEFCYDRFGGAKGFRTYAGISCKDIRVLEKLRDIGWKISDSRYNDPPLHLFVENNNCVGVQFLYDSGVDLANELNIMGVDALTEAENTGNINEAYELLRSLIKMPKHIRRLGQTNGQIPKQYEKKRYIGCKCCGNLTIAEKTYGAVCPVCLCMHNSYNITNLGISFDEARENYRRFGAYHESALPYVREPFPSEICAGSVKTNGYPENRPVLSWFRELAKEMPVETFYIFNKQAKNEHIVLCLVIKDGHYAIYKNLGVTEDGTDLYRKYEPHFFLLGQKRPGFYFLEYKDRRFIRYVYHPGGLYYDRTDEKIVFPKEYGFVPKDAEERKKLTEFYVDGENETISQAQLIRRHFNK